MPSHNIVGSEAHLDDPSRRLVHFAHAHGSIVLMPRRRGPTLRHVLTFLAGVATAVGLALLLAPPST